MKKCMVCAKDVNWDLVVEEFETLFDNVDRYGVECLTENKQLVYEGRICSERCFYYLD